MKASLCFAVAGLSLGTFIDTAAQAQTGSRDGSYSESATMQTLGAEQGRPQMPADTVRPSDINKKCNDPEVVCVLTANRSKYRMVSFRVSTQSDLYGQPIWSPNLFGNSDGIYAHRAQIWYAPRKALPCQFDVVIELNVHGKRMPFGPERIDTCNGWYTTIGVRNPRRVEVHVEAATPADEASVQRALNSGLIPPAHAPTSPPPLPVISPTTVATPPTVTNNMVASAGKSPSSQ